MDVWSVVDAGGDFSGSNCEFVLEAVAHPGGIVGREHGQLCLVEAHGRAGRYAGSISWAAGELWGRRRQQTVRRVYLWT